MIVMNVALDNIYGFKNFSVNFSYPKKIVKSPLLDEHLSDRPSFRYKRVNIIMGGNASGKTTFGKALMGIFNFMAKKDLVYVTGAICDKTKPDHFCLEFVATQKILWRVETCIEAGNDSGQYKASDFNVSVKQTPIGKRDTYEACKKRLDIQETAYIPFIEAFDDSEAFDWYFTFPDEEASTIKTHAGNPDVFERTLSTVMKTLDPAIESVTKSKEMEDTYIIKHASFEAFVKDGKLLDGSGFLSTGTVNGIDIALLLSAIMSHSCGWYYCDEIYLSLQSDLEIELLTLKIGALGPDEQLFFTTHNSDILDMNLPHHSYLFLRKERDGIASLFADNYLKRNTDNLRLAVANDLFSVKPNLSLLTELGSLSE